MQAMSCDVATMPLVVKPYKPGVEARRTLLRELRRRELAGSPAPSASALALALDWPRPTVTWHVANLRRLGWATSTTGRTAAVTLTDAGRNAADLA